jgi:hypothetical protein
LGEAGQQLLKDLVEKWEHLWKMALKVWKQSYNWEWNSCFQLSCDGAVGAGVEDGFNDREAEYSTNQWTWKLVSMTQKLSIPQTDGLVV